MYTQGAKEKRSTEIPLGISFQHFSLNQMFIKLFKLDIGNVDPLSECRYCVDQLFFVYWLGLWFKKIKPLKQQSLKNYEKVIFVVLCSHDSTSQQVNQRDHHEWNGPVVLALQREAVVCFSATSWAIHLIWSWLCWWYVFWLRRYIFIYSSLEQEKKNKL